LASPNKAIRDARLSLPRKILFQGEREGFEFKNYKRKALRRELSAGLFVCLPYFID